ncbi:Pfs domain-containing protein [Ophiocordyceps camponoti-floridani]|uniref:Pfs domain-containing protein n=1 Tax=Ophiocordyceps camponoti-floridani TaxID=2030778 RepID=A0A8H4VD52_9HYPO|nr:Pfs domain-containing protein [Ophiocordyceps camponoti-floridani]
MASSQAVKDAVQLALTTLDSILQMFRLISSDSSQQDYELLRLCCYLIPLFAEAKHNVERVWFTLRSESDIIFRLVQILESLVTANNPWNFQSSSTAKQRFINQDWHNASDWPVRVKISLVTTIFNTGKLSPWLYEYGEAVTAWQEDLKASYPGDGAGRQTLSHWETMKEPFNVSDAAKQLFVALAGSADCTCSPLHVNEVHVKLRLRTHRKLDMCDQRRDDFDMFLTSGYDLQEAIVHTNMKDGFLGNVKTTIRSIGSQRSAVRLCQHIMKTRDKPRSRLVFKVENSGLVKLKGQKNSFCADKEQSPVSLQQLMQINPSPLTDKTKRILAVLLSYSVYHLHDTPWMKRNLESCRILFFPTEHSRLPLRPFLQAQLRQLDGQNLVYRSDDDSQHPVPSLVTLGIILLELNFSKSFKALAGIYIRQNLEDIDLRCFANVAVVFDKCKTDIPSFTKFHDVIERCLDPQIWTDDHGQKLDRETLRTLIYEQIVWPLETELCNSFDKISIDELDKIAHMFDVGRYGQLIEETSSQPLVPGPEATSRRDLAASLWPSIKLKFPFRNSASSSAYHVKYNTCSPAFKFFDDETSSEGHSQKEVHDYEEWKGRYQKVYSKFIGNSPIESPVKIAVLDSGIDQTHPWLDPEQHIETKRNWTNPRRKDTRDDNGHGTFTASLIIDYAPDARIYVAKIADKGLCSPELIAEAIRTAVEEWGVDIISMSFGFPAKVEGYDKLEKAIRDAHSKYVLMFAAASNDGANQEVAYPARDDHVICVYSTDAKGNRSKFSPTALKDQSNMATIGEAVGSAWPAHLCSDDGGSEYTRNKSGTSFATPILAGIAAFLLQYARINLPEHSQRLREKKTMKNVLKRIAQKTQISMNRDGYYYVVLNMSKDNLFGKEKDFVDLQLTSTESSTINMHSTTVIAFIAIGLSPLALGNPMPGKGFSMDPWQPETHSGITRELEKSWADRQRYEKQKQKQALKVKEREQREKATNIAATYDPKLRHPKNHHLQASTSKKQ